MVERGTQFMKHPVFIQSKARLVYIITIVVQMRK